MTIAVFAALLGGFALLVAGAEFLVRGASNLAIIVGLSPLIIGLTVVSYGTSAPELAVGLQSYIIGQGDIALGNIIGSNIFNILMILGMSAVVVPLTVARQLIRLDVPIMIGVSGLMVLFALDGRVGRFDGLILLIGSVIYSAFLVYQGRKEGTPESAEGSGPPADLAVSPLPMHTRILINLGWLLLGLVMLVIGSKLLVYGAVAIAEAMGVSQIIIGLTIVAAGTSMPELATSVVASYRGEQDIAVGNVVGSNIFNVLLVLGATSAIGGVSVESAVLHFDLPVMVAVAIACLPIFYTGNRISRWEGLLFLGYYVAYSAYLIFDAVGHDQIGLFSNVMLVFVIPLTVITLITVMSQHPKANKPLITLKLIPPGRESSKSRSYRNRIGSGSPDHKAAEADSKSPPAK
ncbi:MAG: calcium/sodium antiporter [Leptolyngbyaceae cyanobacterium]